MSFSEAESIELARDLERSWLEVANSMEAMAQHAQSLLDGLEPSRLPETVLRDVELRLRPFSTAIRHFGVNCKAFQDAASKVRERLAEMQLVALASTAKGARPN